MTSPPPPTDSVVDAVPIGMTFRTPGRTVTAGEISMLVDLAWTRGPLHTDREFARKSAFGELILPGPLIVSLMSGLWASCGLLGRLERDHGIQLLAVLGGESRYRAPLVVGDTLVVEVELSSARQSSSCPDRGVLTLTQRGMKNGDELVAEVEEHVLFTPVGRTIPD